MQEIKRCAALVKNVKSMASALEEIAGAAAPPVGASLQEGYICPCCNSSTCATLAVSRQVADSMQKQQAKEFDETAVMLKQAFQEVAACTPFPHVGKPLLTCAMTLADLGFSVPILCYQKPSHTVDSVTM